MHNCDPIGKVKCIMAQNDFYQVSVMKLIMRSYSLWGCVPGPSWVIVIVYCNMKRETTEYVIVILYTWPLSTTYTYTYKWTIRIVYKLRIRATGVILCVRPVNEKPRYNVTSSLNGQAMRAIGGRAVTEYSDITDDVPGFILSNVWFMQNYNTCYWSCRFGSILLEFLLCWSLLPTYCKI